MAVVAAIFLSSCVTINSATISNVKASNGTLVETKTSGAGVLGLSVPKKLAQRATESLKNKGAVDNISTILTMRNWGIIQYYRITAKGTTQSK